MSSSLSRKGSNQQNLQVLPHWQQMSNTEKFTETFDQLIEQQQLLGQKILTKHSISLTEFGSDEQLLRFRMKGAAGGGDRIRIGIFAGIHGDETAGPLAIHQLVQRLIKKPLLLTGYELFLYPVCNPWGVDNTSRYSKSGSDLNREFWNNSTEPVIQALENEITTRQFHGLISLHADIDCEGIYGYVRGAVLTRSLLEPALAAAEQVLKRDVRPVIDGFEAHEGIITQCFNGILTAPPKIEPSPFEIIFETPQTSALQLQAEAMVIAMETVLTEYRKFLSFAADL
ncbi:MAG: succinylglutamate desuccinylase/aspartoacylase family protein [Verrucomicrobiota bacterium]|nr:succinylglutamate desuccinylase/aspartoacylase family protein [Verrucomicrobiota bacterium]